MRKLGLILSIVVVAALAAAWKMQARQLYVRGSLASSAVIDRNGVAYVPIKDVAKAFNLNLQKTSRGYELSESGGANQVQGQAGKIGEILFNGYSRFTVSKIVRGPTYKTQFDGMRRDVTPIREGDEIVVLVCQFKNAMQKAGYPTLADEDNDAITDDQGHAYNVRRTSDLPPGRDLLPGSGVEFGLIFEVPQGTKLQELIYTPQFGGMPQLVPKKFRISLAQQ